MKRTAALLLIAGLIFLSSSPLDAQTGRPDMTFGSVPAESFTTQDSAAAVVLFDHGQVRFDDTYHSGRLGVVYEKHARILILRHDALRLASLTLSNSRKGDAMIDEFKGATYNLENGSVSVTRLDKTNIFTEKNAEYEIEKVAFPNAKEGSIIEYSYRILYPGINFIPSWHFQGNYPERWSEYDISVPRLYDFAVRSQGHQKFVVDSTIVYDGNQVIRRIWAIQDVPPLEKAEPYTTTLKNHLSLIEFQLASVQQNGYRKTYSTTWPQLTHELLKNDYFGAALDDHNRWMDDEVKRITAGAAGPADALHRLYAYVRDRFTCIQNERIYLSQPIKKTWDDRKGNSIADINLLLTALCRHQGLDAAPVILSSRANGYAHDGYPLISEYNYVVTRVMLDGKQYLLDASKPYLGFGQLPELCYNGWGRAIDSTHDRITLLPDSIKESRHTVVVLVNSDSGYTGTYTRRAGVFESMNLRNQLKKSGPASFLENLRRQMADFKQMDGAGFDSLDVPEAAVTWHYDMKYRFTQKRFYLNPIMHERFNSSPFVATERHYPVEMPFCIDNSYVLSMEVPKGYAVEQLPKSQRILIDDSSGFFEYLISQDGPVIHFQVHLQLNRAVFQPEEYSGLRSFFTTIANKEKEPIIFKKLDQ
ncbi:MAG: DUF3858 domain-containing protein [Bacteroidetes bacterium]|nr:DUF3858 domain-containing protein [Bacteroidota bacterium]